MSRCDHITSDGRKGKRTRNEKMAKLTLRERPSAESASFSLETKYEIDADSADGHLPLPKG